NSMKKNGFTLIEVLISTIILLMGITSSIYLFNLGMKFMDDSKKLRNATYEMISEMEKLRIKSREQLLAYDGESFGDKGKIRIIELEDELLGIYCEIKYDDNKEPIIFMSAKANP
ncbi:MAG: type II secretion system protein, partial [bacterium]